MNILKKINRLGGNNNLDKKHNEPKFIKNNFISNDRGYQEQASRNNAIHKSLNEANHKLNQLKTTSHKDMPINYQDDKEENIYAIDTEQQIESQSNIKSFLIKLLNQRAILSNTINKINTKWPERQDEITDMMIESINEVREGKNFKEDLDFISKGKDPDYEADRMEMSRLYDMGTEEHANKYLDFFNGNKYFSKKK